MVRDATLKKIGDYFENRSIPVGNLLDYLKKPPIYYGKSTGLKQIIERFIDLAVSKYIEEIRAKGLSIKYIINTVKKNLLQDGWDIKRYSNIIMVAYKKKIKGGDDARKVVSTNRIDEPPRLLVVKNNGHKVRPKSKPKIPSKKKGKEVKTYRKGRKALCAHCGANVKRRIANETTHINIGQKPSRRYFCSKKCKTEWIYASQMKEQPWR